MNNDPRYIEIPLNDAGHYTTAAGDIEPGTVEYVLDLLNKTVGNPHQTVSKDKLKHIAAQLLARNAMVERENDVLRKRIAALTTELAEQKAMQLVTEVRIDNMDPSDVAKMQNAMAMNNTYMTMSGQ